MKCRCREEIAVKAEMERKTRSRLAAVLICTSVFKRGIDTFAGRISVLCLAKLIREPVHLLYCNTQDTGLFIPNLYVPKLLAVDFTFQIGV